MKKLSIALLFVLLIMTGACNKEKSEDPRVRDILGKWQLDRTLEEEYKPISTLIWSDEYIGEPGDSIVFKANGLAYSYEDGDTEGEETEYKFLTDSTILIEFETYKIMKLTDTEFYIREEETDQALDEKWIYEVRLKR